ncbi:MAG: hypothetical protein ACYCY8_08555 [Burkholderiales bacterium]
MKSDQLHDLWASPDNSRLVSKQFSFRLPAHIAAKIAALCEMYPQKNRTQIVADLLTSALDELEKHLPEKLGPAISAEEEHYEQMIADQHGEKYEPIFSLGGPRARFRNLANQHYIELEKEMGNESPATLYETIWFTEQSFKNRHK